MGKHLDSGELLDLLLHAPDDLLQEKLEYVHPADILQLIHDEEADPRELLSRLSEEQIADIIDEEEEEDKYELLKLFPSIRQEQIVDEMSSDELADLIGSIENEVEAKALLDKMSQENREDVGQLLSYDPDTAGGIMATEFITIYDNKTVQSTLKYLREIADEVENAYSLYVTDRQDHLRGTLDLKDIVTSSLETPIMEVMNPHVLSVPVEMDQEEVIALFDKYSAVELPVVNGDNQIVGIITVDDAMDVMREEATEDIHYMGGVAGEEKVDGSLGESLKSRLPWLLVNLLTAFLASSVVGLFQETIGKVVLLATIMPIVTGMGGNAGTQSMTLIVRGIALGELDRDNALRVFAKECGVGVFTGLVIGVIVAVASALVGGNPVLGLVTGCAMLLNMAVATATGYAVPVVLKKLHVDPALASAVFVTTATDVMGFFFFLGLATLFLPLLL